MGGERAPRPGAGKTRSARKDRPVRARWEALVSPSRYAPPMSIGVTPTTTLAIEVTPHGDPLASIADLPGAFALRSSLPDPGAASRRARWSFFGAEPFATFRGDPAGAMAAWRDVAASVSTVDAGPVLRTGTHAWDVPFTGGAVGYWAYDYGRRLERLPAIARDDLALPDFVLALHDVVIARDEDTGRTIVFSSGLPAPPESRARHA